ncbi:MAG TPA: hypothetical protein VD948_07570 [Rhodothermales bacterium]|nr:hypothetical protein [Rhodothermales bacterium]
MLYPRGQRQTIARGFGPPAGRPVPVHLAPAELHVDGRADRRRSASLGEDTYRSAWSLPG